MSDLKPCPFCGGEASVKMWCEPDTPFLVMCESCKSSVKDYATEAEAIEAWNRRDERTAKVESRKWRKDLTLIGGGSWSGKCQECGRWVKSNECTYCPKCGARLEWE